MKDKVEAGGVGKKRGAMLVRVVSGEGDRQCWLGPEWWCWGGETTPCSEGMMEDDFIGHVAD